MIMKIIQDDANNDGVRLQRNTPVEFIGWAESEGFPRQEMVWIRVDGRIVKFPAQSVGFREEADVVDWEE